MRGFWLASYCRYGRPGWLTLEQIPVALPQRPPQLPTLTIGQLSDLHVGAAIAPYLVEEAVALLNAQWPDLVVITGDFVTAGPLYLKPAARSLAALTAPLGVYAVLGNHDYWCGARHLRQLLEARGIRVLVNEAERIAHASGDFWLIGLDDVLCGKPDLDKALAGVPENSLRILLAHEPDVADTAARYGIALQLSGHSHGGQIRHPGGPLVLPKLGRRYPRGLQQVPGSETFVYTNRGIGTAGPPLRLNSPPQVTVLKLT